MCSSWHQLSFHCYGKLTGHMGSKSVACHPAVVKIPPLPPAKAGTRISVPGGIQGWVDLCYVKADRPGIEPVTCQLQGQRPTAKPPCNIVSTISKYWSKSLRSTGGGGSLWAQISRRMGRCLPTTVGVRKHCSLKQLTCQDIYIFSWTYRYSEHISVPSNDYC